MPSRRKKCRTESQQSCSIPSQQKVKTILRNIHPNQHFHFYEEIDKPTGQVAINLLDFCAKLDSAQSPLTQTSLRFHTVRGDFATWIRKAIGDSELADKIAKIRPDNRHLARSLHKIVDDRIKQLKEALVSYSIIPENHLVISRIE